MDAGDLAMSVHSRMRKELGGQVRGSGHRETSGSGIRGTNSNGSSSCESYYRSWGIGQGQDIQHW